MDKIAIRKSITQVTENDQSDETDAKYCLF